MLSKVQKAMTLSVMMMVLISHALIMTAGTSTTLSGAVSVEKPRISYLHEIILHIESGNRRYDENGKLVMSNRGAMGEMQVMPHTVADPGYGVEPAANSSPEELARVGRDYFDALVREYGGNLSMAFAAYNAGPAKVNRAVSRAERIGKPGTWLAFLPRETRKYVQKSMEKVGEISQLPQKPVRVQIASAY